MDISMGSSDFWDCSFSDPTEKSSFSLLEGKSWDGAWVTQDDPRVTQDDPRVTRPSLTPG